MKRFLIIAVIAVTLTACAQQTWRDYSGNNRGNAELRMDLAGCQQDSQAVQTDSSGCTTRTCVGANVLVSTLAQTNAFNTCMEAKGWERTKTAPSPTVESKEQVKKGVANNKAELFSDVDSPSIGNAKTADVTLVEFFDYNDIYSKRMLPDIAKLVDKDKKVRVIFKEFPILSNDSVTASRAALAVNRIAPDKYFAFHTALMQSSGKFDEQSITEIAEQQDMNINKLKSEMAKHEITTILDKNRMLGEGLGLRGSPAIVAGDKLVQGSLSYEGLKNIVNAVRSSAKKDAEAPISTPQ